MSDIIEIGTFDLRTVPTCAEIETFPEEKDASQGDLHLFFDKTVADYQTGMLCPEILDEVQKAVRSMLKSPNLTLEWRERGAQGPGFYTFSFQNAAVA